MDEIERKSSFHKKVTERDNSFGNSTECQSQTPKTQDENKFQFISYKSSSKTIQNKQDYHQTSETNTDDIDDTLNKQGKLTIGSSTNPQEKYDQIDDEFDSYNVARGRCQTMDPKLVSKKFGRTSIEKQTKRQSSFPCGKIDQMNIDMNLIDNYIEDDSDNENNESDSDCSEDMQNIKEEQRDQIVKLEDDESSNKLKRQQTLKIEMGSMYQRQKSLGMSSEKKQKQRKTSETQPKEQYILNLENVDIKNPEHSEYALELFKKKKNKNKQEKQFLLKMLRCCSIFQKNKNLISKENQSLSILDWFSYQFMPKNTIVFNQGEYGNTYYIVLAGACFCLIPDPDYKSKERFFPEQFQKRKAFFLENPYTKVEDPSEKDKTVRNLKRENSQASMRDTLDPSQKKNEKDQTQLLTECFPMLKQVHVFQSGESFGDIALITNDRRTATLVCKEDTHFLTLTKEGYEQMIGVYEARLLEEEMNFLREFSYFKHIVRSRLLQIRCWMKEQTLCKKSVLYKEGEPSNAVYFIRSGEIEISQATEILTDQREDENNQSDKKENDRMLELNSVKKKKINKMNTKRVSLAILGANQYFGQNEVLDSVPLRIQQAQCISQTAHVYMLPKQRFTDMIRLNHSSMEKIRNEEKQKFKWKQDRLQMISETRSQNSYKNVKINESTTTNKDSQFLDVFTPSTTKSQNQLLAIPSQFGYSTPSNFNNEYDETRRHSSFGLEDTIKEAKTPSQTKRMQYSQMRNKSHSTFSRCVDFFNNSTFSVEFDMLNSRDATIQKEEKQQEVDASLPETIKISLPAKSPKIQSTKNSLQNMITQSLSVKPSYLSLMNNSASSPGKNSDQQQSSNISITQANLQKNKLNSFFENMNQEQKMNKSCDFKSLQNSPTNNYQRCQVNPVFSRFHHSQAQQNNQNIFSNNTSGFQNSFSPQQQVSNQQLISSTSFHESLNSQNTSHMDYLKMVHQSLVAKKDILEKLQYSSQQICSNNQTKIQIPTLGDASSNFSTILQEDTKIKHQAHLRISTQPNRSRNNNSFSQTPTKIINKNLITQKNIINRIVTQECQNKPSSLPSSPKSSTLQSNTNEQQESQNLKHSSSVQMNKNLPQIQNTQIITQTNQNKQPNQANIFRIFKHPNSQIPQRQKSNTFQENLNQQKNNMPKTYTFQFTRNNKEEQSQITTQEQKGLDDKLKQDDSPQYDMNDSTTQQSKDDPNRSKFIQKQGHRYYLSGSLNNNSNLTLKTINTQQSGSLRTLPNIEKVRGEKSLDLTNINTKKCKSNSFSITNSLMISNLSTPKKEDRVSFIFMEQQQRTKSRQSISQDSNVQTQQNLTSQGEIQNNKQSIQINSISNGIKFNEKKSSALQTDIQNFIDFGKLGKSLKLDKVLRSNKDKNLLNKLVEQQQAKIQQIYVLKNNQNSSTIEKIEKDKKQIPKQTLESSLLIQKLKKQNQLYEQAQNPS